MKVFVAILTVFVAVYYFMGDSDYHRVVDAPPDKVAAALISTDIREAPGAPATDPERSGGLPSEFAAVREGNDVIWTVTNGGDVAVRMIAHLAEVDGAKTAVTLDYERGEAPDDRVAPALRSRGTTLGLLAMVVEDKLDRLTMPLTHEWDAECDAIMERFQSGGDFGKPEPDGLGEAQARYASNSIRLSALDKELKAAGCPQNAMQGSF